MMSMALQLAWTKNTIQLPDVPPTFHHACRLPPLPTNNSDTSGPALAADVAAQQASPQYISCLLDQHVRNATHAARAEAEFLLYLARMARAPLCSSSGSPLLAWLAMSFFGLTVFMALIAFFM